MSGKEGNQSIITLKVFTLATLGIDGIVFGQKKTRLKKQVYLVELVLQHCYKTSLKCMLCVLPSMSRSNLFCSKPGCCKLREYCLLIG